MRRGGLIAYPTDSCYALGCRLGDAQAIDRLRRARGVDDKHHLTLMCRDLSELSTYAIVDNVQYRLLRAATPGSYTFILRATPEVPRRTMHPKRRTIGMRVTPHPVARALLGELGEPVLSATLITPGSAQPLAEVDGIDARFASQLDLIVDSGGCGTDPTTVVDLTTDIPEILRQGRGPLEPLGIAEKD